MSVFKIIDHCPAENYEINQFKFEFLCNFYILYYYTYKLKVAPMSPR